MTDREVKNNGARRRLLKSVVAGGGVLATGKLLPENWARPVVQSVVLPAHAQTSPGGATGDFGAAAAEDLGMNDQGRSILDLFVQPAHALAPAFSANVGNVAFDAYWTVRENDAVICGEATWAGSDFTTLGGIVGRSGDRLDDFSQNVGAGQVEFTNQRVTESGVSLTGSDGNLSRSLFAPPGPGCSLQNLTSFNGSSSPYSDDEGIG